MYVLPYGQMSLWGYQLNSPTCDLVLISLLSFYYFIMVYLPNNRVANRISSFLRVGPHNLDIMSIFYGALLGDAHAERRSAGHGTRISFYLEATHSQYLAWLHQTIAELGYCNPALPQIQTRLGAGGVLRYIIRFHSFTYSSLNSLYDSWYTDGVKHVPTDIVNYLTPLALAIWIMDDGARVGYGLKLASNSITFADSTRLALVLFQLYGIKATVQKAGAPGRFHIYIWSESMPLLRTIVRPYMVSSMLYKLGE